MNLHMPVTTISISAIGSMNFQAKFINWSMRRRGKLPRTQMNKQIKAKSFVKNQTYEGIQVRNENGALQPPRNNVTASPLMANIPGIHPKEKSELKSGILVCSIRQ
jgi:hypothetical protein